jgi:hypothetical protein
MEKNTWRRKSMDEVRDGVKITTDIEATDLLGMLVRKIQFESPHKGDLRKQAQEVVEKITYLGGELKVIEVDGVSNAVQIRSRKLEANGYVEVILRGGNFLSLERKPASLHISKGDFERLVGELTAILLA